MRTLAIDLGNRRIGLAMSDEGGRFATPLEVLEVSDPELAIQPIVAMVACEGVRQVAIGLPFNMDDSVGPAAKSVLQWAKAFARQCSIPIVFVDERLSSFVAEQQLIDRKRSGEKLTRGKKKRQLDALAATDFLQAFLDGQLRGITFSELNQLVER